MSTTLQSKTLLVILQYDFKVMHRGNSPNGVQKWYLRGTNFFEVQTVQKGYCTPKWGTVGNPGRQSDPITGLTVRHTFLFY
ncbi:unnamed protein product [Rotaria magnacalcarata]